jgi:hypothetical protein
MASNKSAGAWNLPEMQAARDRRTRRIRRVLLLASFILFLVFVAWLVIRSPLFRIRSFAIQGAEQYSETEIVTLLEGTIFGDSSIKHILGFRNMLIWPPELSEDDMAMYPLLRSVSIEKDYPRRSIVVRVSERVPLAIWCYLKTDPLRCVWFDSEGVILERSLSVEGNLIRRISDSSQEPRVTHSLILPAQFVSNLFSILSVLDRSKLPVGDIRLEDLTLQEVRVKVRGGPELMFSLRFSSHAALSVLNSLRAGENMHGKKFSELQYVDFRVENRAYFK